jgi:hypothetical protein
MMRTRKTFSMPSTGANSPDVMSYLLPTVFSVIIIVLVAEVVADGIRDKDYKDIKLICLYILLFLAVCCTLYRFWT